MKEGCIFVGHLGWTDIILCFSIPFYLTKNYKNVVVIIMEEARLFCDFLYSKNSNIKQEYLKKSEIDKKLIQPVVEKYKNYEFIGVGSHWNNYSKKYKRGGIEYFYSQLNIPVEEHYNSFYLERNLELEEGKFTEFKKTYTEKYIVVNEDIQRGLKINRKKIKKNKQIFNINNSSQIFFDMIKILEESEEIHLISTCWSMLIKLLQKKYGLFNDKKIYFHNYVRKGYYLHLYTDTDWIILN